MPCGTILVYLGALLRMASLLTVVRCPLTGFAFLVYSYLVNLLTKKKSRQPSKQGQAQKDFKNEAQECHQSKGLIGLIIFIVV